MPPRTRLAAARKAKGRISDSEEEHSSDSGGQESLVEVHLTQALKDARKLQKELKSLRKRNEELQHKLDMLEEAEHVSIQPRRGKRSGPTVSGLQSEIKKLKGSVQKLEKAREKDRRTINQLRMREIRTDAAELEDNAEFEIGDSAHHMRKLLRRFHDLIVGTSLEEREECPICMDELQPNKCASLPCEHTFCEACITQLSPGEDQITCPQCRQPCLRDEVEVVQYTASQQWDALLEVATNWAKMDRRREDGTSEEEAEEEFIDDELPDASTSEAASTNPIAPSPSRENESEHEDPPPRAPPAKKRRAIIDVSPASSPEPPHIILRQSAEDMLQDDDGDGNAQPSGPLVAPPTTPPRIQACVTAAPLYAQSPAGEKRRRMEELAASRKHKLPYR